MPDGEQHRRHGDEALERLRVMMCWCAARGRDLFDWIDKRQIDAWAVLFFSLYETANVLDWAMDFANAHPDLDAIKMAAVIAAVVGPWVTMQGALVKFYFDVRTKTFSGEGGKG